LRIQTGDQPDG